MGYNTTDFVTKMRKAMKPFEYEELPPDGVKRFKMPKRIFDDGVEYDGEMNERGERDGRGV